MLHRQLNPSRIRERLQLIPPFRFRPFEKRHAVIIENRNPDVKTATIPLELPPAQGELKIKNRGTVSTAANHNRNHPWKQFVPFHVLFRQWEIVLYSESLKWS